MDENAIERLQRVLRNTVTSTVNVNAGGLGIWIATTLCLVMLTVALMQRDDIGEMRAELRDHRHQLNAIYMMAPHLKPKAPAPAAVEAQP